MSPQFVSARHHHEATGTDNSLRCGRGSLLREGLSVEQVEADPSSPLLPPLPKTALGISFTTVKVALASINFLHDVYSISEPPFPLHEPR